MEPAIRPGKPESVALVRLRVGEARRSRSYSGRVVPPGTLGLDDRVPGRSSYKLERPLPQTWQGDARSRPPPAAHRGRCAARGELRPPLPSPPIIAPSIPNGPSHVGLADRRADEAGPRRPRRILNHQAGGEVDHHGRVFSRALLRPIQHGPDRERQGVVLADRLAPSRPPAPADPRRDPPPGRSPRRSPAPARPSSPRFSGTGSGAPGKPAVGLQVDAAAPGSRAARAAAGWRWRRRRARSRGQHGSGARGSPRHRSRAAPGPRRGAGRPPRDPRAPCRCRPIPTRGGPWSASARTRAPASASRKMPSGPTNLSAFHSIGIVARGEDQAGAGVMMLHGQLDRGRRDHPQVDHVHARPT